MNVNKIQNIAAKISNQRHLISLRDGMATAMPLIIVGSVFMLIANFPIESFSNWLSSIGLADFLNKATNATFGIVGLVVTFAVSYHLSKQYGVDRLSVSMISLSSFVLLTPILKADNGNGFPLKYLGTSGLFVGIIVAIITTEIFTFLIRKNFVIKMPDTVPPNVSRAFSSIIPGLFIITFWFLILILFQYFGIKDIHILIANTVEKALYKNNK